jgi:aerobic C4-dicarboxylate transport protein
MVKKIASNLTFWVLFAITSGILVGHFFPATGVAMQPLGKYFIYLSHYTTNHRNRYLWNG